MSPMGQYKEEVCVLAFRNCVSAAAAAGITFVDDVDVSAYSRLIALGIGTNMSHGVTLDVEMFSSLTDGGAASTVDTAEVYNPGAAQDMLVFLEVHESQLPQGQHWVNVALAHDDGAGNRDLSLLLLGAFPREKPCEEWSPGITTTVAPTTTTTAG